MSGAGHTYSTDNSYCDKRSPQKHRFMLKKGKSLVLIYIGQECIPLKSQ